VSTAATADRPAVHVRASDAPARWRMLSLLGQCGFPLVAETMVGTGTVVVAIATTVEEATEMYLRPRLPGDCSPLLVADTFSSAGVLRALQAGASTMLCSSGVTSVQVSTAVQAAYCGDSRVPQQALVRALGGKTSPARRRASAGGGSSSLTDRQRAVVALMAEGLGNAEVAQALSWSEHTVKNVGYELMASLQVRNRAQAVAHAIRNGLI
jgi:DNA-binding NarL/FixJ family response regulator